ncbi:MAG: hypothetical protein DRR04_06675 [Gammaproteobacteria bacterium]|nr:MAG: hypothetical protein DRQ97_01095 [Gammaproteobacteria bacterium]RLA60097.1 MAG: hypothetical protein DRR04_06675 [Gammaproteobacteria bacterium]
MRQFNILCRLAAFTALAVALFACSSTATHNPTTFPFKLDEERLAADKISTVVIAHVNLSGVSRNYLEKEAPRIDAHVRSYLKENGFTVLPQREFQQHWNVAVRAYGDPVDPTSGKTNMKAFVRIMQSVRDQMAKNTDLDAFIFTDVVELEVAFNGGLKHLARWDGVTRKPSLQGPGSSVSSDFDWNMLAAVASLKISIYDMELKRLFTGRGGIDATEAIDTRSAESRYIKRRYILENKDNIMEGIGLAFYPFIDMQDWPGDRNNPPDIVDEDG